MKFDLAKAEVFDRTSAKKFYPVNSPKMRIDVKNMRFYLNHQATQLLAVNDENYIRFFRMGKTWFLVMTESAEGYSVKRHASNPKSGSTINARVVVGQMLSVSKEKIVFFLSPTEHELAGKTVYELLPSEM